MTISDHTSRLAALVLATALTIPAHAQAPDDPDATTALGDILGELRLTGDENALEEEGTHAPAPPPGLPPPPVPLRRDAVPDDDPYAPLGIRAGAFLIFPSVEMRTGYTDNVDSAAGRARSGTYGRLLPEIGFQSDWSRHEMRGRVAADYRSYADGRSDDMTGIEAELAARIDVRSDTTANLRLSYVLDPEGRGGSDVTAVDHTDAENLTVEARLSREFGRLRLSIRGTAEDKEYGNAALFGGETSDSRRNHVATEGAARASLAVAEGSAVFLEAGVNRRRYDRRFDENEVIRGSQGSGVLAGVEFRTTPLLTGEVGVGYHRQIPDDPSLPDISGLIVRGSLIWQPTTLTTVALAGEISPEESIAETGASGVRLYRTDLSVAHSFRRNLIATARFGYERADYAASARRNEHFEGGIGLEYLVNRSLSFVAEASHERFETNLPDEDYQESTVELGVRVRQ